MMADNATRVISPMSICKAQVRKAEASISGDSMGAKRTGQARPRRRTQGLCGQKPSKKNVKKGR
jgi:hypothetical protein